MKALKSIALLTSMAIATLLIIQSCSKKTTDPVAPAKSSAKSIATFSFNGISPAVNATIDETAKTIIATLPAGSNLTGLVPTITLSAKATVSPATGAAQDFSKEVDYTVTAEDGSTQIYKVTVTIAKAVTQAIDCNNVPAELTDRGDGVDYSVGCSINLSGSSKVLTVDPGVTIQFTGVASGIIITNGAAVKMVGTADKPIVLEGSDPTPGSWTGIQIASNNILNQWQYVTLMNAGGGTYNAGLLIGDSYLSTNTTSTQMSIKNCTFTNNKGYGIWEYDNVYIYPRIIFSAFESNTFTNNSLSGMKITADAIGKLDTKSTYVNNGQKYIEVNGAGGLHNNTVMQMLDAPYVIMNVIGLGQKLTVMPGVNLQFNTDMGFTTYIGSLLTKGTLIANGTAALPIKFTGFKPGVGSWMGLILDNSDPQIALNYCIIDGAGSIKPNASVCQTNVKSAISFYPSCSSWSTLGSVTNCTISNSGGYGIVYKKGTGVVLSGNTYTGNTLTGEAGF